MPAGRPPDFKPDFGERIIKLMRRGLSLTAAAASLGVHRQRVYEWEARYPEFADAVKLARGLRTLKLERDLLAAADGPVVTARIFALKNAAPEEWREKQEIEQTISLAVVDAPPEAGEFAAWVAARKPGA